jgi:hypothetical protein
MFPVALQLAARARIQERPRTLRGRTRISNDEIASAFDGFSQHWPEFTATAKNSRLRIERWCLVGGRSGDALLKGASANIEFSGCGSRETHLCMTLGCSVVSPMRLICSVGRFFFCPAARNKAASLMFGMFGRFDFIQVARAP